jgi:hypothetical protein
VACSRLPNLQTLAAGLTSVLRSQATVLDRQPNTFASTFPSEIVRCQLGDGRRLLLLCKYGADHSTSLSGRTGHKGGVPYEAAAYRHVLRTSRASTPKFYGAYEDVESGETWLVLEYLEESVRLRKLRESSAAMGLAARWIGRFHNATEEDLSDASMRFLSRYDAEYYLGWARRTSSLTGHLRQRFQWLPTLCERFEVVVPHLLASPPTVIHGEYYPSNILFRAGKVYPIDWESAAVAAGELDLATLTENWGAKIERRCELEYQSTRWPEGTPADFGRRLCSARLYLQFRWLCHENRDLLTGKGTGGERWDRSHKVNVPPYRLEQLRSLGDRLDLI